MISTEETLELLKTLRGKKSCGLDWICGFLLKLASKELVEELRTLINLSIISGKYYSGWKYCKVLPGFKNKESKIKAKNYSLLANRERCVCSSLWLSVLAWIDPPIPPWLPPAPFNCNYFTADQQTMVISQLP